MPLARRAGFGAAAALLGCVESPDLFTETIVDVAAPPVAVETPASIPTELGSGPSAGSPDAMSGGAGSSSAPSASEAGPPLVRVDPPPLAPGASGAAPEADPEGAPAPAPPAAAEPSAPEAPGAQPPPIDDATGEARVCPELASPLLLDFEQVQSADQALFGDFQSVVSGGTFVYPERSALVPADAGPPPPGVSSDVTGGDWLVSGVVAEPAGFGLFFDCQSLDASRFGAIAFRIQGAIEGPRELTFFVGSAGNDVSRAWLLERGDAAPGPSLGRCRPAAAQFDGSCQPARVTLPVTSEVTEVVVPFASLAGGSPEPGLNPAEITTLQWALPAPAGAGAAPYAFELRIDDIRFVESE